MKKIVFLIILIIAIVGCANPAEKQNSNVDNVIEVPHVDAPAEQNTEDSTTQAEDQTKVDDKVEDVVETIPEPPIFETENKTSADKMIQSSRCQDSDVTTDHPDGINIFMKGTITVNGKPIKGGTDFCTTTVKVSEWYCQNGVPRVYVYSCLGSCKDAACLES